MIEPPPNSGHDRSLPRLATGIGGFDVVCGGGLPYGRGTLVAGTSGSGKTVFGLQFLVTGAVERDEPGVLVTFEERPSDLFANVAAFGWEPARLVAENRLAVVDATPEEDVAEVGPYDFRGLLARIEYAARRVGAVRVYIDAIDTVFAQFSDTEAVRRELRRLFTWLRDRGLTSLASAERPEEYGPVARRGVEEYASDSVVVLRNALEGRARRRTIEVLKLRGYMHNKGEFPFVIDPRKGITVVPASPIEIEQHASSERISLGVPELDLICRGGIYRDSQVMISGATGTGKSVLGAHFAAAGVAAGERVVIFSFEESPEQITRNMAGCGIDLAGPCNSGRLRIISQFPERMGLEDLLVSVVAALDDFRPRRVVLDSLTALQARTESEGALRDFLVGFTSETKSRQVGAMVISTMSELFGGAMTTGVEMSTVTDGILQLRYLEIGGELRRALLLVKLRGTAHDHALHEYRITDHGMRVMGPLQGVEGVLGGTAHVSVTAPVTGEWP